MERIPTELDEMRAEWEEYVASFNGDIKAMFRDLEASGIGRDHPRVKQPPPPQWIDGEWVVTPVEIPEGAGIGGDIPPAVRAAAAEWEAAMAAAWPPAGRREPAKPPAAAVPADRRAS